MTVDSLIESVNIVFALVALYGVVMAITWRLKNHLSERNTAIVIAWLWMFLAVGIQAAWFGASRHFAGDGDIWLEGMYETRVGVKLVTMLMFSWGMFLFVRLIEAVRCRVQLALFSGILLVGFGHCIIPWPW